MPRKTRRPGSPAPNNGGARSSLLGYIGVGLVCAALGSGGTYLTLRPALRQASSLRVLTDAAALTSGNAAFDQKNWAQAVANYTQAIAAGSDNADIRTDLGTSYRNLHQPQQALEQFQIAQREQPGHENSLLNQGIVYAFDLGDKEHAIAIWRAYLQKFPQGQHAADAKNFIAQVQAHGLTPVPPGKAQ